MPLGFRNREAKGRLLLIFRHLISNNMEDRNSFKCTAFCRSYSTLAFSASHCITLPSERAWLILVDSPAGTVYKLKLWFEWIPIWCLVVRSGIPSKSGFIFSTSFAAHSFCFLFIRFSKAKLPTVKSVVW